MLLMKNLTSLDKKAPSHCLSEDIDYFAFVSTYIFEARFVYLNPLREFSNCSSLICGMLIHFSVFSTTTSHPWTDDDVALVK